ncbi:envelope membrane protein (chloroplast) [Cryptomeria japonica]|uniref:Potassium/proton antiporter CemA n=3 Tax=Cryptomeria japonica TaxID=3369 RepID=CEMA_CRYJA|nr:envelope membrane protein [Cryptomeria japonica]B1VKB8.1 RecName: Full=Potassium/proton antiporter CemA; AltName: Full=Chloroplast envelope membrane protein A; Short=CemA [Cryptomeria japonica]QLF67981.1 envelope membrane protein [Cryptomeria japonica var. sinensis]UFA48206.1 chloroplast envelope membrane protein [Cryptomeria japonica var. sinensis]UFA48288.1 chloroplast envelope membrane protein [Cryptomeria japonica var. sinensis]UFA48370.1 chloroplast envelope membrane protein [Cryptomer
MDLIPRSIIRTLFRFWTELTSQSSSLAIHELEVAKYKTFASLQYLTCLIVLPWAISISLQNSLESWVTNWWNTGQSKKIFDYLQEENAIRKFEKIEELFLLEIMVKDYSETPSQDIRVEMQKKMIQLVKIYNQDCIHIISHLLANLIGLVLLSVCLILGKKKLGILNSWIQEVFYSLSDTMKAFSILLVTDLCIGFHSPHGWELMINWIFENYGFAHNERIISGLVSTFPVILDTIFKYWIFRRLNRISPSLVVIYHSMNE